MTCLSRHRQPPPSRGCLPNLAFGSSIGVIDGGSEVAVVAGTLCFNARVGNEIEFFFAFYLHNYKVQEMRGGAPGAVSPV